MRRLISITAMTAALCVLTLPAQAAATTRITTPLTARQGIVLTGICGFPVLLDERGGLLVTTTYDAANTPLRYDITGTQTTRLTNLANGLSLLFDTLGKTTIVPNADGTATVTQVGSGLAIDQGSTSGDPTLAWFTGSVTSTGVPDTKTLLLEVTAQQRQGLSSDICEMLISGLKTRH